jgi:hypothetical protein
MMIRATSSAASTPTARRASTIYEYLRPSVWTIMMGILTPYPDTDLYRRLARGGFDRNWEGTTATTSSTGRRMTVDQLIDGTSGSTGTSWRRSVFREIMGELPAAPGSVRGGGGEQRLPEVRLEEGAPAARESARDRGRRGGRSFQRAPAPCPRPSAARRRPRMPASRRRRGQAVRRAWKARKPASVRGGRRSCAGDRVRRLPRRRASIRASVPRRTSSRARSGAMRARAPHEPLVVVERP